MLIHDVSMRDTFVSIASHELRTPLTAITGYSDLLLRRDPSDATRRKWLKTIFDNSQRISSMANDLLNVSRIQAGKIPLELDHLKLPSILSEQIDMAKEFSDKHEFVVDIEPHLPEVIADRDKFGQVVANLLNNAIKYSPDGGRITLSAHHYQSQNRVIVSITDEGIGISPEDKDSLFTTFHRIQRPETHSVRGSGLGLFIAKEWTEAMGGNIWVESELNKGSTFFIAITTQFDNS
jgi:two-component system sensor histidine kinase VicK